jgi:hypothetical protein
MREHYLTTAEAELWQRYMPERSSVYGSHGYARICERLLDRVARLHVVESEEGWISYPMHLRSLSTLPFVADIGTRWDSASPEFTGPQIFGEGASLMPRYLDARRSLAGREGIVAEFAHLHPWSDGQQLLGDGVRFNREIIWIDTTLDPEFLRRNHLEYRRRKALNKAEREGLKIVEAESPEQMREYVRIYRGTMARNDAKDNYFFTQEYFDAFRELLPSNSRFTLTIYQDRAIGALLVLFDDDTVYAYLGGSDAEYHLLNAATFQIWDAICWAHRSGKKRVILGGGYTPGDGIYNFKVSFSPLLQRFNTYNRVHLPDEYARLEQACRSHYMLGDKPMSYFPAYRYTPTRKLSSPPSETSSELSPVNVFA